MKCVIAPTQKRKTNEDNVTSGVFLRFEIRSDDELNDDLSEMLNKTSENAQTYI